MEGGYNHVIDVRPTSAHITPMNQITTTELEKLGRDAACEVAGPSAFEHVAVEAGGDFDNRPVYIFGIPGTRYITPLYPGPQITPV